eukprot:3274526-Pleurochrysis_carterae.AAC.1
MHLNNFFKDKISISTVIRPNSESDRSQSPYEVCWESPRCAFHAVTYRDQSYQVQVAIDYSYITLYCDDQSQLGIVWLVSHGNATTGSSTSALV